VANAHDYQRKIMTSQNPSDGKLVHLHLQLVNHLIHRPLQISKLGSQLLNCQYKTPGLFPQNRKKNPFSGSSLHFLAELPGPFWKIFILHVDEEPTSTASDCAISSWWLGPRTYPNMR